MGNSYTDLGRLDIETDTDMEHLFSLFSKLHPTKYAEEEDGSIVVYVEGSIIFDYKNSTYRVLLQQSKTMEEVVARMQRNKKK